MRQTQAQGSRLQLLELGDFTTGSREMKTSAVAFTSQPCSHNLDSQSHGSFLSLRIFTVRRASAQSQMTHVRHVTLSRATIAWAPDGGITYWGHLHPARDPR